MKNGILRCSLVVLPLLAMAAWSRAPAQSSTFAEREVIFRNGPVDLHGTLMLPAVQKPAPAVVFLHGSGPHPRAGFRPYAESFARLGIASLFFDKRGSGESGGSWVTSSLDDLAGDAIAAVDFLKAEKAIDPKRIGFWTISQSGWVGPLAAARFRDIAFMIVISGGGAPPRDSELFSYHNEFEEAGFSDTEKSQGSDLLDTYYRYLATGKGRPGLVERLKAMDANHDGHLYLLADRLKQILPSLKNRPNWSWVANYDPLPDIEKVTCPVLLMFGDKDREQPTDIAVERWREGLHKAGNEDVTVMIFPGAGHGIRMGRHHSGGKRPPFADGYWDVMVGWLWRHVLTAHQ